MYIGMSLNSCDSAEEEGVFILNGEGHAFSNFKDLPVFVAIYNFFENVS